MSEDRATILDWAATQPTMARTISAAAKLDRLRDDQDVLVRFAFVRNITLEPGLPAAIKMSAAQKNMRASVELGNFGAVQEEAFSKDSFLYTGKHDVIVVALQLQTFVPKLFLDFSSLLQTEIDELVSSTLDRLTSLVEAIRDRSTAIILVHNFSPPVGRSLGILEAQFPNSQQNTIRSMNLALAGRLANLASSYIVDVDYLLGMSGYETSLDERYWHIGRAPYTFSFIRRLADEYVKFATALKGKNKKCLVLDCDNTLWGGVIGEDGLAGIALGESHPGSAFVEFHHAILNLYKRGVLLAINSKNNHDDVIEVFEKHRSALLKRDHFVAMKINWNDKVSNLREIATELNIGLDSLVFVDDNPFECERVREVLPEVEVIHLPTDPTRYARLLSTCGLFDTLAISDEDRRRSEMYRSENKRSVLKESSSSMDDYLRSLDMELTISRADRFSIPRIAQLTQKTNQFNLTTRRYAEGDIAQMSVDSRWRVYYSELSDKFDRAGIIAVAIVDDCEAASRIDTFLMSCRVIGRGVEQALLAQIVADTQQVGRDLIVGEFIPTNKNGLACDFLSSAGFTATDSNYCELSLAGSLPQAASWFKAIHVKREMVNS